MKSPSTLVNSSLFLFEINLSLRTSKFFCVKPVFKVVFTPLYFELVGIFFSKI